LQRTQFGTEHTRDFDACNASTFSDLEDSNTSNSWDVDEMFRRNSQMTGRKFVYDGNSQTFGDPQENSVALEDNGQLAPSVADLFAPSTSSPKDADGSHGSATKNDSVSAFFAAGVGFHSSSNNNTGSSVFHFDSQGILSAMHSASASISTESPSPSPSAASFFPASVSVSQNQASSTPPLIQPPSNVSLKTNSAGLLMPTFHPT
jgi:hypothetical protein